MKIHPMITHWRDRSIRLKSKSSPEIQFTDGLEALGPVHMCGDVSPRRGKVVVVFTLLWDAGVRGWIS